MNTSKLIRLLGLAVLILVVGIQFVPVSRTNPPVQARVEAPEQVLQILRGACFDCHSNETVWPWYAYVAPVSWTIARDVEKGRKHLNFSDFGTYSSEKQAGMREEIWEEVEEGAMPLAPYVKMHRAARLSDEQKQALKAWSLDGAESEYGEHDDDDEHEDDDDEDER